MDRIDALDAVSHCLHRLKLISGFVVNAPDGNGEGAIAQPLADALYFSLVAIEDDLEKALVGLSGSAA